MTLNPRLDAERALHRLYMQHLALNVLTASILVSALASCDAGPTTVSPGKLTLDVVSGDRQSAIVGRTLAPVIVKVTKNGYPVASQVLNFRVTSGGGSVYGGTELTDADGLAQELWTLGTKASDPQRLEVRAVGTDNGQPVVFATYSATAVPDRPATLAAQAGNNQVVLAGSPVLTVPAVLVSDQYGNPIPGVPVTFAVGPNSGTATGLTPITATSGIATVGSWILSNTAGVNILTATTPTLTLNGSPVTFTAVGSTGAATRFVSLSGNNQVGVVGSTLPRNLTVQVLDANGNGVPNVAVTFTITAGGGSIHGVGAITTLTSSTATVTTPVGSASVPLTLGSQPGGNSLQASAEGLSGSPILFTATGTVQFLYVSNQNGNRVTVYAPGSSGDATPALTIEGSSTGLNGPTGIARDASGYLYVANYITNTVTVFAPGANGNVAPARTIAGSSTGLTSVRGLAIDAAGNLYVVNTTENNIVVFAPGADGNVSPIRTIAGSATGLQRPIGIGADPAGTLYVTNLASYGVPATQAVTVYAPGATGNASPTTTITGSNTGLYNPIGIALDALGNLYVSNFGNTDNGASNYATSVTIFAAGSAGNVVPTRTIPANGLNEPAGLAIDASGQLFVVSYFSSAISVYAPGATLAATVISGGSSRLNGPWYITF